MLIATKPACSRHNITLLDWIVTRLMRFGFGRFVAPRDVQTRQEAASGFCAKCCAMCPTVPPLSPMGQVFCDPRAAGCAE
jgi:hypothetical protein